VILLVADLFTLMWLAMRLSLRARSINEVVLKCLFWVLVLPGILYTLIWPAAQWLIRDLVPRSWDPQMVDRLRLTFWFGIGLLTDVALVRFWARPKFLVRMSGSSLAQIGRGLPPLGKSQSWRLKTGV
jgi:hypothetical protein